MPRHSGHAGVAGKGSENTETFGALGGSSIRNKSIREVFGSLTGVSQRSKPESMKSRKSSDGGGEEKKSKNEKGRSWMGGSSKNSESSTSRGGEKSKRGASRQSRRAARSGIVQSKAPQRGFGEASHLMEYKSPSLGLQLTEALSDEQLADVTFVVGPERKVVRGLRIVMAARNKHLRRMLYEERADDGGLRTTYEQPLVHGTSFELMMKFIHSGGLSWEPHQTVQLLEVAIDFEVTELVSKCMELIADSMTESLSLLELTKLIQILLKGDGFDVNLQHPKTGTSALHIASREGGLDLVKDLISRNANLKGTDSSGATALHFAKTVEVAELLIANGADVNQTDHGGNTPLVYAMVKKRPEVAQLLIGQGCHERLFTLMQEAVDRQSVSLQQAAIAMAGGGTAGAGGGGTLGEDELACELRKCATPEALLQLIRIEAEAYPSMINPPSLVEAAKAGSTWGVRSAINRGEDVNQRDEKEAVRLAVLGYTPLHWACAMGYLEIVQCLLASEDIDVNPSDTEDEFGYTPLQLCRNYQQRQWQQCMSLLQAMGGALWPQDDLDDESDGADGAPASGGAGAAGGARIAGGGAFGGGALGGGRSSSTIASRFSAFGAVNLTSIFSRNTSSTVSRGPPSVAGSVRGGVPGGSVLRRQGSDKGAGSRRQLMPPPPVASMRAASSRHMGGGGTQVGGAQGSVSAAGGASRIARRRPSHS